LDPIAGEGEETGPGRRLFQPTGRLFQLMAVLSPWNGCLCRVSDNLYYPGNEDGTHCMAAWLLTLGILFIVIAIFLMLLGFIGRVAWTNGKWLIIIFIVFALLSLVFSFI